MLVCITVFGAILQRNECSFFVIYLKKLFDFLSNFLSKNILLCSHISNPASENRRNKSDNLNWQKITFSGDFLHFLSVPRQEMERYNKLQDIEIKEMRVNGNDIGKAIKTIRKAKNISRLELSEAVGISKSHIEKIEAGLRCPRMDTYQKILKFLGSDMMIHIVEDTPKEKCMDRAQEIFSKSSEKQAEFLIKVLECISEDD